LARYFADWAYDFPEEFRMSTSTSPIFSGTSTFSADFSQVISRAVSIASLPIDGLNTTKTTLTSEQSALSNLSDAFASLQSAVAAIGTAVSSGNYAVSSSDSTVASASAASGALLGTYTLEVVDPGSQARAASTTTVTDPTTDSISSSPAFTLVANGQTYNNIMPPPGANTLTSLVSAINTATQGAVQATIVNVGSPSQPSYQLSVLNTAYGDLPITLDDGGGNLLGTPTPATPVQYRINGQPDASQDPISSDTRSLAISPGLTVNVLKAGTADITVGQSTSGIANAINNFVKAFNSAAQALAGQRGSGGGALAGQSLINTLSQSLDNITGYNNSGTIQTMADLGLTFDTNGVLSFDSSVLTEAAQEDFPSVISFLGNSSTGGFLQTAANTLSGILDSTTGAIPALLNSISGEITDTDNLINRNQDRVDQMQKDLTARMSAADAAIAQMQQQLTYVTNLFTAMTNTQQNASK
jgi:flagellar hook-associated protein 2